MADASWEVQKAIYAALKAALNPVAVYDHVPRRASFPYVTIGEDTAVDAGDKTAEGQDITLTIHAWSRKRGRKEVKQLLGQVRGALHGQPLTVAGYTVRLVRFEFGTTFKDADGVTYHGVQRYRIVVDDV